MITGSRHHSGASHCHFCQRTTGQAAPVVACWQRLETHAQQPAAAAPTILLLVLGTLWLSVFPIPGLSNGLRTLDAVYQSRSIAMPYSDRSA